MATKTVADAISDTRGILQDRDTPYRYSDADLVASFNNALLEAYRYRPDLFYGYWGADDDYPSFVEADLNDATKVFPIDEMYFTPVVYYTAGFAELRDDEFTVDNRAVTLLTQFVNKLTKSS